MVSSSASFDKAGFSLPQVNTSDAAVDTSKPNPYIINPAIDFIFIYGGVFWVLMVLHVALFGWNAATIENLQIHIAPAADWGISKWFVLMAVTTPIIISNTHTWATYMRIYGTSEDRERFRFYGRYLIFMPLVLFVSSLFYPPLQGWIIYLHMGWVFQHYTSQTYGVGLIYCYKREYYMNNWEKQVFKLTLASVSAFVITRLLCIREEMPIDMWGVALPFANMPRGLHYAAVLFIFVMAVVFAATVARKYFREKQMMPLPCLTMLFGVALLGTIPGYGGLIAWLWAPPFLHGAQYCLISLSYYLKERGLPDGLTSAQIGRALLSKPALKWMMWAILGGNFIYIAIPHIMSDFGWSFMAIVSIVQGCVNFHHFLTDAAIWKLRDAKTRRILIS